MSAKRGLVLFGAKSAHEPEATARALAEGRTPDAGRVEKDAKLPRTGDCEEGVRSCLRFSA